MTISKETFLSDYFNFCNASMLWCSEESEKEVTAIYEVLNSLIHDTRRRSALSKETISIIDDLQKSIKDTRQKNRHENIRSLLQELSKELKDLTDPIIKALQFQDRLRQNLENIGKILALWAEEKQGCSELQHLNTDEQLVFIKKILSKVTTPEERSAIKKRFPAVADKVSEDLEHSTGSTMIF